MNKPIIFCFLFLLACSTGHEKQISILTDDLFAIKNLKNSSLINSFKYQGTKLFSDSTMRSEFTPLDCLYKSIILAPLMKMDLGVEADYSMKFILSHFISKQEKIGRFQPIVIYSSGDDYSSLILVVLDSTLNPISHLVLSGGFFFWSLRNQ